MVILAIARMAHDDVFQVCIGIDRRLKNHQPAMRQTMRTAAPAAAYIRFIKTPYWLLLELSELLELLALLSELLEPEFLFSSLATWSVMSVPP